MSFLSNIFNPISKQDVLKDAIEASFRAANDKPEEIIKPSEEGDKVSNDLVKAKQRNFLEILAQRSEFDPMRISPVFCAVNLISNSIAIMPWKIRSYDSNEVPTDIYLNHITDNMQMTKFMLVKNMIKDVLIYGDGFAYIDRDKNGMPVNLQYVPNDECCIYYNKYSRELYYRVSRISGSLIEPINMIHLLMNSKDGMTGRGILWYAKNIIDLCGYTDKAAQEYFANGMSVQGILKSSSPARMTKKQRSDIRKGWDDVDGGIRVLGGGLDYQQVQSTSKEAELTANRILNVQEVSRFFNVNPVKLNELSHMSYNTIEQADQDLVTHTLSPYIVNAEQEFNRKLVMKQDKLKYFIDIDEEAIIKTDKNSLATYLGSLVNNGIITRNEARIKLGMNPLEGADVLTVSYTDVGQNTIAEENKSDINEESKTTI